MSTFRSLIRKTIDDGKEKSQVIKLYDFTNGVTDIVDQLNDYYTIQAKYSRWVMLAFFYMFDYFRFSGKTVWCLKHKKDISNFSSYDFGLNFAKALALPHVGRRKLHSYRQWFI